MIAPTEIDYEAIGQRVRQQRKELHLSQAEVAEMTGISTSFVGHIERGTKIASIATIIKLALALDTTTDYLLLDIERTCAMEECELFQDLNRLFRAYGFLKREND